MTGVVAGLALMGLAAADMAADLRKIDEAWADAARRTTVMPPETLAVITAISGEIEKIRRTVGDKPVISALLGPEALPPAKAIAQLEKLREMIFAQKPMEIPTKLDIKLTPERKDELDRAAEEAKAHFDRIIAEAAEAKEPAFTIRGTVFFNEAEILATLRGISESIREEVDREVLTPMEEKPLRIYTAEQSFEDQRNVARTASVIRSGLQGAFSTIESGANVMVAVLRSAFRSMADIFIGEVSRMIAKWLVFQAITNLFPFPFPGGEEAAAAAPVAPRIRVLQAGGTILSGARGRDTVLARVGRGETVITHRTTDALDRFLETVEAGGFAGSSIVQHFHITASTLSAQDAVRFARTTERERHTYNTRLNATGLN